MKHRKAEYGRLETKDEFARRFLLLVRVPDEWDSCIFTVYTTYISLSDVSVSHEIILMIYCTAHVSDAVLLERHIHKYL